MKKNEDKRLLSAIDHIDDRFVDEAAKKIRERDTGVCAGGANKNKIFKQVALLAACLVLLGAALPLAGRLVSLVTDIFNPAGTAGESGSLETNENEPPEAPEEYFTDGTGFLSYPSYFLGVEYEGCWIHTSGTYKDFSQAHQFFEFLYKYDPVAKESKSLCINPACKHSDARCPVFVPGDWNIDSITVFDDWCLYQIRRSLAINETPTGAKVCLYNMKTGEARVITEKSENGDYPFITLTVDSKVYIHMLNREEKHAYISCYDPATDKTEYMFDIPYDMYLVGMTNKRFFLSEEPYFQLHVSSDIRMIDYSGENYRKMANLTFHPMFVSGTYAYGVGANDTVFVYDLTTDTASAVNFSEPIQHVYLNSGELGFTTTSRIEEFKEYQYDPDAYIAKNYPNVTGSAAISKLKNETEIKLNCKVKTQFYLTDPKGENKTLVFEGENINFNPYRRVGDYIIGYVRKASKYEVRILDDGFAALNLKTGEIAMVPALEFED